MLLRLYLEQLSPSILKKISEEHKKVIEDNAPNNIVDFLNNYLIDFNNLSEIYKRMTQEEKEVISYFILQIPNEALSYRRLDKFKGKITRNQFEFGLNKLNRKGIIFVINKGWGNTAFIIPEDLFLIWHKFFLCDIIDNQKEINVKNNNIYTNHDLLDEGLYRILVSLQIEPIPISKGNSISKKNLNRLAKHVNFINRGIDYFPYKARINISESELCDLKTISLILEIAYLLELVEPHNDLTITENALSWHNLDKVKRRDFLEKAVCSCFKSSDLLVQNIFYLVFNIPENRLISFNDLVKDSSEKFYRPFGKEILHRAKNEILQPLFAFGWIEMIEDEYEKILFRWLPFEKDELIQIYVQPNFEVLIPYTFPHSIRLKIEQFTTLVQNDFLNRYVLSKESILKGLDLGLTKKEIITLLKKYSTNQVNNNILQAISDWAKSYGQVSFLDIRIMKCSSESIAEEIKTNNLFKKWIIEELNSTNFIVRKSNYNELIKVLDNYGIFPRKEIWDEGKMDEEFSSNRLLKNINDNYLGVFRYKEFDIENKLVD